MSEKPLVLILAAGLGTRMKSKRAKVLHEVAGRPLIAWAVEIARAAGAERVVAVLGHQLDDVRAVLDERYGEGAIDVAHQAEQKGTGHAVLAALPQLENESDDRIVIILTGDAPLFRAEKVEELAQACVASPSKMALVSSRAPESIPYGRLLRNESGRLLKIIEDADASDEERAIEEVNAGFYAISLGHLRADVARLSADNAQGELYLTDLAAAAAERGGAAVIEAPFHEISGINDRADLARVSASARARINAAHMAAGVTLVAPEQTFIDADIDSIGADTWIASGVHLRGKTSVGTGVRIDTGAVLESVEVGDEAWIKAHSFLTDAVVGSLVQVGPFAHCRPGTVLDEGAKIGNFVETKKTHMMAGSKANHLSYLGDASVGAGANIGAGTITCNYDGVNKYKTTIESGAFIGSDTQLIAPVTVGRDAYVGSGTTVTKDVPRASLALSRTKQVNKIGWADRFREAQKKRKNRGGDS